MRDYIACGSSSIRLRFFRKITDDFIMATRLVITILSFKLEL